MNQHYYGDTHVSSESRATFVMRTYAHLFLAILAFVMIEVYLFSSGMAETIAVSILSVNWLFILGGFMVAGWLASFAAESAESKAMQYGGLLLYVLAQSIIFVPLLYIANTQFPGVIQSAAQITIYIFAGLTLIAFYTRADFSFLRTFLMLGGFAALGLIAYGVLFGVSLGVYFSFAMAGLAGAAILYDTSNVIHHYPEDRYIGAALRLFASVALMFWYIIQILMALSGRD